MVLRFVLRLAPAGEARGREAEILVLRHQLKTPQRKAPRPKLSRLDKPFLASAISHPSQGALIRASSSPSLLRWHRELARRKWTYKPKRTGGPPLDLQVQELVIGMAKENPRWGYIRIQGECRKLSVPGGSEHHQAAASS
jgi:hypothetical protein